MDDDLKEELQDLADRGLATDGDIRRLATAVLTALGTDEADDDGSGEETDDKPKAATRRRVAKKSAGK